MYIDIPEIGGFVELLQWVNQVTDYWFGPLFIVGFWAVFFFAFKRYNTEKAFAAASLLAAVLCFFFLLLDLTGVHHLMTASIAAMASLFMLKKKRGSQ